MSIPFKIDDAVKYDDLYSAFTWYGTVVKVNPKTLVILSNNGHVETISKNRVNFD